jgi:outer membrane protein OmpA-like peptidoglycan-associated protein
MRVVQTFGIAAARLATAGFGDTKPIAPHATDDGRAQNRRVELVKR